MSTGSVVHREFMALGKVFSKAWRYLVNNCAARCFVMCAFGHYENAFREDFKYIYAGPRALKVGSGILKKSCGGA